MRNFAQVTAISNGTLVSYLEPVKQERLVRRGPRPGIEREVEAVASEIYGWELRWRTVYCKDLDAVQAAMKQAFHANETAIELAKKGVQLHDPSQYSASMTGQPYMMA
ncbi:MAG: hypothetical protein ACRD1Z_04965 [Vicinamibacteria bacterium]